MSDYTPTTEEAQAYYIEGRFHREDDWHLTIWTVREGEFNRWLAEVRATALEEAADEMEGGFNADTLNLERRQIKRWLRTRAKTIREGKTA